MYMHMNVILMNHAMRCQISWKPTSIPYPILHVSEIFSIQPKHMEFYKILVFHIFFYFWSDSLISAYMMLVCSFLRTVTASLREKYDKNENKYEPRGPFET